MLEPRYIENIPWLERLFSINILKVLKYEYRQWNTFFIMAKVQTVAGGLSRIANKFLK